MDDQNFFSSIPAFEDFLDVANHNKYVAAPAGWQILISDICDSTGEIDAGRYKEVNVIGVASIAGVRNACGGAPLPYSFGGDGATLLIPGHHVEAASTALNDLAWLARKFFQFDMRAGVFSVDELQKEGLEVLVGKYRLARGAEVAMFAGSGIEAAHERLKNPEAYPRYSVVTGTPPDVRSDFSGVHCRWKPMQARNGCIVSVVISATGDTEDESDQIYLNTLKQLSSMVDEDDCKPVQEEAAVLTDSFSDVAAEAAIHTRSRHGIRYALYQLKALIVSRVGAFLMLKRKKLGEFDGRVYRKALVERSDYRKFDGSLRMVLDLTSEQVDTLRKYLDHEQRENRLRFGLHVSDEAFMTCLIDDRQTRHMHFIDGSEGGYWAACKALGRYHSDTR